MKQAQKLLRWITPMLVATLAGCASGPELEKYPRSLIDRPYTLPHGADAWLMPGVLLVSRDADGTNHFIPPIGIPLGWKQSLSDDWQLSWSPLPLALSHQISHDDSGYLGAGFGVGGYYSSIHGF